MVINQTPKLINIRKGILEYLMSPSPQALTLWELQDQSEEQKTIQTHQVILQSKVDIKAKNTYCKTARGERSRSPRMVKTICLPWFWQWTSCAAWSKKWEPGGLKHEHVGTGCSIALKTSLCRIQFSLYEQITKKDLFLFWHLVALAF